MRNEKEKISDEVAAQIEKEKCEFAELKPASPSIDLDYENLPVFIRKLLEMISPTTLAPDEFLITALLPAMAASIGTRAYIQLARRIFYPTIWSMLIAPSSDFFKSTAIKESRSFIFRIDKEYHQAYKIKLMEYNTKLREYQALSKKEKAKIEEPRSPIRKEIDFSDDETLESFYQTLHDNHEGGLLAFDEIGGWIECGSF